MVMGSTTSVAAVVEPVLLVGCKRLINTLGIGYNLNLLVVSLALGYRGYCHAHGRVRGSRSGA